MDAQWLYFGKPIRQRWAATTVRRGKNRSGVGAALVVAPDMNFNSYLP
jgi:hypothetical protein